MQFQTNFTTTNAHFGCTTDGKSIIGRACVNLAQCNALCIVSDLMSIPETGLCPKGLRPWGWTLTNHNTKQSVTTVWSTHGILSSPVQSRYEDCW